MLLLAVRSQCFSRAKFVKPLNHSGPCFVVQQNLDLDVGISEPEKNVATIDARACVIEGVSRSRNALINGDTKNYDWDSGYTCHQLGSGAIVVQLAQPYVIGSMRCVLLATGGASSRCGLLF